MARLAVLVGVFACLAVAMAFEIYPPCQGCTPGIGFNCCFKFYIRRSPHGGASSPRAACNSRNCSHLWQLFGSVSCRVKRVFLLHFNLPRLILQVTYRGYRWYVNWGDGVTSYGDTSALMPAQLLYTCE